MGGTGIVLILAAGQIGPDHALQNGEQGTGQVGVLKRVGEGNGLASILSVRKTGDSRQMLGNQWISTGHFGHV